MNTSNGGLRRLARFLALAVWLGLAAPMGASAQTPPPQQTPPVENFKISCVKVRDVSVYERFIASAPVEQADCLTDPRGKGGILVGAGDLELAVDDTTFDKVMQELDQTTDEAKRSELYGEAQKILAQDAPVGFLFELPKIGVWDAKIEGLWENAPIPANDLTKVKWVE